MSDESSNTVAGPGARQLAELFHATYERLAPQYGYTTRSDTRRFDHGTENGKLMVAVCDYILTWLDEKAPAEIDRLTARVAELEADAKVCDEDCWRGRLKQVEAERDRLRAALEDVEVDPTKRERYYDLRHLKHDDGCTRHGDQMCQCGMAAVRFNLEDLIDGAVAAHKALAGQQSETTVTPAVPLGYTCDVCNQWVTYHEKSHDCTKT